MVALKTPKVSLPHDLLCMKITKSRYHRDTSMLMLNVALFKIGKHGTNLCDL